MIGTLSSNHSLRDSIAAEEWKTRVELAACYRLVARFGMSDLIYNHITARVPGTREHFLINPFGLLYEEITASSLYKIDIEGNILYQPDTDYGLNYAGFVIHSAIHGGRVDAMCVIHTHTRASVAVAAMKCGLLPISQHALRFYQRVSYHDYEGPAVDLGERRRLVEHMGSNDVMLLRNHGSLTLGRSIPEAFNIAYFLEMACRIQIDAMAGGAVEVPSPAACEAVERSVRPDPANPIGVMDGSREWPAMLRLLDRSDKSYAN